MHVVPAWRPLATSSRTRRITLSASSIACTEEKGHIYIISATTANSQCSEVHYQQAGEVPLALWPSAALRETAGFAQIEWTPVECCHLHHYSFHQSD